MVLGFIGLGNMAKAMLSGILKEQFVAPEDIIGSSATEETMEKVRQKYGIQVTASNREVAKASDVIILAVKPVVLPVVME